MAKQPIPVTVYDLECTALDAKDGWARYRNIAIWHDDATRSFTYKIDSSEVLRGNIIDMLKGFK